MPYSKERLERIKVNLREKVPEFAHKVKPIYDYLDWHWGGGTSCKVPSLIDIEQSLYEKIEYVDNWIFDDDSVRGGSISGGGLAVTIDEDGEQAALEFTLAEDLFY